MRNSGIPATVDTVNNRPCTLYTFFNAGARIKVIAAKTLTPRQAEGNYYEVIHSKAAYASIKNKRIETTHAKQTSTVIRFETNTRHIRMVNINTLVSWSDPLGDLVIALGER